ncbi:MAG: hypothetical protein OEW48_13515 [Phycisphaerae bacterium]|nr:hypothetical protein [Phycisphaerae bacterium]
MPGRLLYEKVYHACGTGYSYDDNGNLTDDGTYLYYYDCENRLTDVNDKSTGNPVASYSYDYQGRRISKTVSGVTTKYCYDGARVIAEYDGSNNLLRKFIYGPGIDKPICMIDVADSNTVYYYHFDGLGSVIALSDQNADLVESYSYDVFGQPSNTSDVNNPYLFTGRRYDDETGLYYYRARYYDPHTGRFLQTDPLGYIAGTNLYVYCGNSPIGFVDPMGYTGLNNVGSGEKIDVLFEIGPLDSMTAYVSADYAGWQYTIMTDEIILMSELSEDEVTPAQKSQIANAVLHGLLAADLYKNLTEENAADALRIHEEHGWHPTDTPIDLANNVVGKDIGLGVGDGDIYSLVLKAYYEGRFYGGVDMIGNPVPLQPLPDVWTDKLSKFQQQLDELGKQLEKMKPLLDFWKEHKKPKKGS